MTTSRRHFLHRASLFLSGAALASPVSLLEAAVPPARNIRRFTAEVPLSAADQTVLDWVLTYAAEVRLVGAGVLGKLRGSERRRTRILASIPAFATLDAALEGILPFGEEQLFANGNTLTLELDGTEFTIINLLGPDFEAKLGALLKRVVNFATDALTWDPATGELTDPFGATVTEALKIVNPGGNLAELFATLLRGITEAEVAKLEPGPSYKAFRRRVLGVANARPAIRQQITRRLLAALPDISEILSDSAVAALLASPLLTGGLRSILGLQPSQLFAQFASLHMAQSHTAAGADSGLWLALLLAKPLAHGTADAWYSGQDRFEHARFRRALAAARGR